MSDSDSSTIVGTALARLALYARLVRLHQPIGIWLLGWSTLWALWIASRGHPDEHIFRVFVLGIVLTRSAGCAINDFADRRVDPHVKRTRDRPLAAGLIRAEEALLVYGVLSLMALALVLTLDRLTIVYAAGGAALTLVYPFLKRIFPLPQAWLGLAFSWGVPMAFVAVQHQVPTYGWLIFAAGVLWALVYDTEYAMVDRDDDERLGVRSTAILFGRADRAMIGLFQLGILMLLWRAGADAELGTWFHLGLSAGGALFLYQQLLIRDRQRDRCFRAFRNNAWFGLLVFLGVALDYLFR